MRGRSGLSAARDEANSVGASLVHSARPNLVHSAQQSSQSKHPPPRQGSSKQCAAKPEFTFPRQRVSVSRQPVLAAAAAGGSGGNDASFEEF
jgi:hypothetical protein